MFGGRNKHPDSWLPAITTQAGALARLSKVNTVLINQITANALPSLALSEYFEKLTAFAVVQRERARILGVSQDDNAKFEFPLTDESQLPAYARLRAKSSRFLARSFATKKLSMRNSAPLVSFTFDDAPASACEVGALLLEQHQACGTYYVSGAGCGRLGHCGRMASADQVKSLFTNGHEVGCHTYAHTPVTSVGRDALAAEVERNRRFLQGIHGDLTVRNFAYPYGQFSLRTKLYLQSRFDSCRTLRPGVNARTADLGALKSCMLDNASIDRQGIAAIVAETACLNGWLIFASHDVDDNPSPYSISPDLLSFAIETAHGAGCRLVTVHDALHILSGATNDRFKWTS